MFDQIDTVVYSPQLFSLLKRQIWTKSTWQIVKLISFQFVLISSIYQKFFAYFHFQSMQTIKIVSGITTTAFVDKTTNTASLYQNEHLY